MVLSSLDTSITSGAQNGEVVKLLVLVAQLTNRQLTSKEALEIVADVRCSVAVSIERDHAVLVVRFVDNTSQLGCARRF